MSYVKRFEMFDSDRLKHQRSEHVLWKRRVFFSSVAILHRNVKWLSVD